MTATFIVYCCYIKSSVAIAILRVKHTIALKTALLQITSYKDVLICLTWNDQRGGTVVLADS